MLPGVEPVDDTDVVLLGVEPVVVDTEGVEPVD